MEFYSPQAGTTTFGARPETMVIPEARKAKRPLRWVILGCVAALLIAIPGVLGWWYIQNVYSPATPSGSSVTVKVEPGMSVDQISHLLVEKGLLSHPTLLKLYLKLSGRSSSIQAGDFTIKQHISIKDLVVALGIASRDHTSLRFTEGWRREEMADYVTQQHQQGKLTAMTGDQFSNLALNPSIDLKDELGSRLPSDTSLQGYLFPDTYQVDVDESADSLLKKMLENYKQKVTPEVVAGFSNQGLNEYQGLIMASIVEREARMTEERPVIAGILLKRLKTGVPLGVDATLQYALGYSDSEQRWWRQNLTVDDLALDSPYNTRKNAGLPPHPICNPGLTAIQAVAQPQMTDYLYYMHDSHGVVHYAKTLEEHNANVARYL